MVLSMWKRHYSCTAVQLYSCTAAQLYSCNGVSTYLEPLILSSDQLILTSEKVGPTKGLGGWARKPTTHKKIQK